MNFKDNVEITFKDSSIHGLSYFVKRELHWTERIFWFFALTSATYCSIDVCLNQWQRFRENPIVYAVELTWGKTDFPYSAMTICSSYFEEDDIPILVHNLWNITANDTKFEYYAKFLHTINSLRFDTLNNLRPFANDTTLNNINYLNILLELRKRHSIFHEGRIIKEDVNTIKPMRSSLENGMLLYAPAITESGMCRTTSQTTQFTNPFGKIENLPVNPLIYCGFFDECDTKVFPLDNEHLDLRIYLHSVNDVVSPNHRTTILREIGAEGSLTVELILSWTAADMEVRNLPVAYRKCRYPNENNLQYFDTYQPGLCRMECRINVALAKCNCKPFFYVVAPKATVCDVNGMLCLAKHKWWETRCDCVPLCDEITYTSTVSVEQSDVTFNFVRTIVVKLSLPAIAIKRRVVFSTDQLIMSFGGAVGLFLGASFLSIYGLIYRFTDFLLQKFINYVKNFKNKKLNENHSINNAFEK